MPHSNEVLIRVHATTVNRTDCANLTARPFIMRFVLGLFKPRLQVLGTDLAGEIVATGSSISSFSVSDRVFGFTDTGLASQAEYVALPPKGNLATIPDNIDYQHAAASLEGAHYAYAFIRRASIKPGQSILINGASGAIGSALLQFARQYGAHITATCSTKNIALIKSLGADKVYDYTRQDFTRHNDRYDFIFDTVGKSSFGKCRPLLKSKGVYTSSELGRFAQNPILSAFTALGKGKKVIFPVPYSIRESLPFIKKHLQEGTFKPIIDREYPLEAIAEAYAYVLTGQKTGNVVLGI